METATETGTGMGTGTATERARAGGLSFRLHDAGVSTASV
jgi:hypothetical protein